MANGAVFITASIAVARTGRSTVCSRPYRRRAKVENCVGWLKENRRVGTRYDKLAASFLAFVNLAIVRRYLRILPRMIRQTEPNPVPRSLAVNGRGALRV